MCNFISFSLFICTINIKNVLQWLLCINEVKKQHESICSAWARFVLTIAEKCKLISLSKNCVILRRSREDSFPRKKKVFSITNLIKSCIPEDRWSFFWGFLPAKEFGRNYTLRFSLACVFPSPNIILTVLEASRNPRDLEKCACSECSISARILSCSKGLCSIWAY